MVENGGKLGPMASWAATTPGGWWVQQLHERGSALLHAGAAGAGRRSESLERSQPAWGGDLVCVLGLFMPPSGPILSGNHRGSYRE